MMLKENKYKRRDRKLYKRRHGQRESGRSVFVMLRQILKRNRLWRAGTLDVDVLEVNTDGWRK